MWLSAARAAVADPRRRRLAGPSGCGLFGIESLADAARPPARAASPACSQAAHVAAAAAHAVAWPVANLPVCARAEGTVQCWADPRHLPVQTPRARAPAARCVIVTSLPARPPFSRLSQDLRVRLLHVRGVAVRS